MVGKPPQTGKGAYLTTMITLASAAFGVIAALAWNAAITELFRQYLPAGAGIVSLFIYAIVVTLVAVFVMVNLANAAQRISGENQ